MTPALRSESIGAPTEVLGISRTLSLRPLTDASEWKA